MGRLFMPVWSQVKTVLCRDAQKRVRRLRIRRWRTGQALSLRRIRPIVFDNVWRGLLALLLCLLALPTRAQDDGDSFGIGYGVQIDGTLDNRSPRAAYAFDGLRGEVVSITLIATSGDLDPMLTIIDSAGGVLASRDDAEGGRDVRLDSIRLPASGRYTIIVGRFGYGLGTTSGDFTLRLERIGVSSASGSALRYGDTVINRITDMTPQIYYSFQAERGDILNITMQRVSGDLDAYLQVADSQAVVIADNDDTPSANTLDAQIVNLAIPQDGVYVIIATRFGEAAGSSSGAFYLTLEEADLSGLGASAAAALDIAVGDTREGEITANAYAQFYAFSARQDDIISARMEKIDGSLDPFLALADATLLELTTDDDGGGGKNAQIDSFRVPSDGTYYLIATRFDRRAGETTGRYRLILHSGGSAFDGVPPEILRINYGITLTGSLDDTQTEHLYAFWGRKGDALTISLTRADGDLDPFVAILNADRRTLISNDDADGQNARIDRFTLPETGVYYLRAARAQGEGIPPTRGSYLLVLAQRFD